MKVSLSVPGRFQFFNLAEELQKHGVLERLVTSQPKFKTASFNIPRNKVRSILTKEILERGWRKLPRSLQRMYNPQYAIHEVFDWLAAGRIGYPDIVAGGSSVFLHTLRRAKASGILTVVEHGSSHIVYQEKILREEYERFGIAIEPFMLPHPKVITKEMAEYAEADAIAIPSSYVRRTFVEQGVAPEKMIQVPYGVDLSVFRQIPKEDDVFRVIFGGGLSLRKGTHYLLQAFAELALPNSELLLIGAINEEIKPFLQKYAGTYRHLTYRPMPELHKFYSQGSVFVLPSLEEGLAMVQPQAMACGLPVICTTNTGGEDIVRDGLDGFVIPIRDTEKLKEKILFLYNHPDIRAAMGQSAKQRVSAGFTWDDYGRKMIKEYEKLLNTHRNV